MLEHATTAALINRSRVRIRFVFGTGNIIITTSLALVLMDTMIRGWKANQRILRSLHQDRLKEAGHARWSKRSL